MRLLAILVTVMILAAPVSALVDGWGEDSVIMAIGMGMFAKEVQWQAATLKEQYASGEINRSYCQEQLDYWNKGGAFFNRFIKGNFNSTIYQKWKIPTYSV